MLVWSLGEFVFKNICHIKKIIRSAHAGMSSSITKKLLFFLQKNFPKIYLKTKPSIALEFQFDIWFTHNSRTLQLHKNILKRRQSQASSVSTWIRSDPTVWRVLFLPDQLIFDFISLQNRKKIVLTLCDFPPQIYILSCDSALSPIFLSS